MAVLIADQEIKIVRASIALKDFPKLLQRHRDADFDTDAVEQLAGSYVSRGFDLERTSQFVRKVCVWGNYPGISGKVLRNNSLEFIREQLKNAHAYSIAGQPGNAIRAVTEIRNLAVSFGSKHLRFLHPDGAVVLDVVSK